jgi:hypothetical protein
LLIIISFFAVISQPQGVQRIEIRRDGLALIPRGDEQCEFDFDFL